ncbi:hypothetical protein CBR_g37405 [Chara braunii]|uniref:non-specific serine/threonine protein kinase n=1 Tax=Chara braunii TaxID=69332 RepID=A0A388LMU9_CHABU|nr:hypothetical protein CBR_g37405 [Chara braunii]|eukprot:GBG83601.1 hypothetical protein CBR_g37405 [Chara braunii]
MESPESSKNTAASTGMTKLQHTKSVDSGANSSRASQRLKIKQSVCENVLKRLAELGYDGVHTAEFTEQMHAHFHRLPTRYALDVNAERAEDVLTHKNLLDLAQYPENQPVFFVRPVHVLPVWAHDEMETSGDSSTYDSFEEDRQSSLATSKMMPQKLSGRPHVPMHEVTFSTIDKPKILSQISAILADVGLNIREAHIFSTIDGYSLDVFVVDGWGTEGTTDLLQALKCSVACLEKGMWARSAGPSPSASPMHSTVPVTSPPSNVSNDDWELDNSQLKVVSKIASGSFGDLFKGTYCGQVVAIKFLKPERMSDTSQKEFAQEVFIMRKVRHKNVVQFIGACTKPPNLAIVTEYMSGGSVYDYLRKHKVALRLPLILKIGIDVARGMDYLHQNNIVHRDLKAANLLLDENEVVKIADFGVARIKVHNGIMTAETGTYRWMAPEVIEHRPYDHKADVFSFGIVLWELLTGKIPYVDLTPLQAAVGVVNKGLRPAIPKNCHPRVMDIMEACWRTNPAERPEFSEISRMLQDTAKEIDDEGEGERKREKKSPGFFSFKRTSTSTR